jgi:hypothetical protein
MKKTFALLLALSIMILCASCGGTPADEQMSTPQSSGSSTSASNETGTVYTITAYYDADGGYSALGSALSEATGEKVLTVKSGDVLIAGSHSYSITTESLTIPFYTQPSLDEVLAWWTDYCQSRIERGEMVKLN